MHEGKERNKHGWTGSKQAGQGGCRAEMSHSSTFVRLTYSFVSITNLRVALLFVFVHITIEIIQVRVSHSFFLSL